ncbi:MAG: hypothetical protein ACFFF9_02375 [Candidatus Thorarchaeota archaeon]
MKKDAVITEITSIIKYIEEAKNRVSLDHDKFQIALTNTLRLLNGTSPTLAKLKGDSEDLKGYLIKTCAEMRESSIQPYHHLRTRMEKVLQLLQTA